MSKTEMINYLNKIRPFLNLKAVCEDYNHHTPNNCLDYNNLRVVLNGISPTRVSEEKLYSFISYIRNVLLKNTFDFDEHCGSAQINQKAITEIIESHCQSLTVSLIKEINNEI